MHTECYPISILPRLSRLFLAYAEHREPMAPYYSATPWSRDWAKRPVTIDAAVRAGIADLLEEQNRGFGAGAETLANIARLREGAAAVITGQQVTLFGGPLFTLLKAATAIRKAREANAVPIFWMATEDHDLEEADHVSFPTKHELLKLKLAHVEGSAGKPVGGVKLGEGIAAVLEEAAGLLGPSDVLDAIEASYTPDATYAEAFGKLLTKIFAGTGLVLIDAASRGFHALGAPVLRAGIERAAELEAALLERGKRLEADGYAAQVLVNPNSSLLFLIDKDGHGENGIRLALKRREGDVWTAGKRSYTTAELLAILEAEPERLSPNALLRPVFQDFILPTAAYIGGPAEIAYFAQSQVLYEKILGRTTAVLPRLSATLVEPAIAEVMKQHGLSVDDVLHQRPEELAARLGARAIPIEGKQKLAAAGNALDAELNEVTAWMTKLDDSLGRSAGVAASKMRYQMNRLRRMAANFQLQKEASLRKHVDAIYLALYPDQHLQERAVGAAAFLAKYGMELAAELVEHAAQECPGHRVISL
ncbi:bacillithiol biosynthesis cysteine-adding enzyme BshC [Silvibacterium dinghuense]|uniref:Putative cysteine ligase BshC n=1 Tax=Silvibacterium dinghuense TaxID=1560006 RepID=A0A4Q1SBK1_9BACT|nr:bacillithiol biosynthesis cysteine-adding enzyme BshC [Silvibacterium dinghuense]RXS94373.1 bacillithiol biosynthesis cysteine-adding enzyme BshC [Silvibacterium dinghuense]GGH16533.1 putative cysteine ligase BshC [Silvibacterium dinghuense]